MSEQPTPQRPFSTPRGIKLLFAIGGIEVIGAVVGMLTLGEANWWPMAAIGAGQMIVALQMWEKLSPPK